MFWKIAASLLLFSACAVSAGAQECSVGPRDSRSYLYELKGDKQFQAEYRARLFAGQLATLPATPQEKAAFLLKIFSLQAKADIVGKPRRYLKLYFGYYDAVLYIPRSLLLLRSATRTFKYMFVLQAEANRLRERRQYSMASTRYYEAALYLPKALLFLKSAEARLEEMLTRQYLYPIDIRFLLDDHYQLAVEFSRYERPEERSLSGACLDAVKRKIACLQSLCRDLRNTPLQMEDVRRCHALAPDIFRYEWVCK